MSTQRQIKRAIRALVPTASFAVTSEGEIIRWTSEEPQPIQQEINDKIAEQEAQDVADAAQKVEDDIDKAIVTGSADIRALVRLRPQEIEDWMNANVTNLAEAKTVMIRMAKVVSILAKQMFR